MGKLKIISVTSAVPHSACNFDFADIKYEDCWRGFAPEKHHSLVGKGKVYDDDESSRINHAIIFEVPDTTLVESRNIVCGNYQNRFYAVGVSDCVSFSADVARMCGLNVPLLNFTPYGLILVLRMWNDYIEE
jgi:hypothetical protein